MNLLHDFKDKPFIDAVQSFFENLKVPFNVISDLQTDPINIIGDKKCNEIISAIYPFGIVTDEIFDNKETTFESLISTIAKRYKFSIRQDFLLEKVT